MSHLPSSESGTNRWTDAGLRIFCKVCLFKLRRAFLKIDFEIVELLKGVDAHVLLSLSLPKIYGYKKNNKNAINIV